MTPEQKRKALRVKLAWRKRALAARAKHLRGKLECKPCPFCGRQYKGKEITMQGRATRFECDWCGACGPFPIRGQRPGAPQPYYDKLTLDAWNTRTANKWAEDVSDGLDQLSARDDVIGSWATRMLKARKS